MRRGCPHCTEPPPGLDAGHTYYIVWHCPAARAMWKLFCAAWSRLGVVCAPTDPVLCTTVFSLRPLQTPALAWSLMGEHRRPADLVQLADAAITLLWQQQVLGCLQRIWQWRQGVQDEEVPWTPAVARSALESSLRSAYAQVAAAGPTGGPHAAPVRRLLLGLQRVQLAEAERVPRPPRRASDQHLLFFDGVWRLELVRSKCEVSVFRITKTAANLHCGSTMEPPLRWSHSHDILHCGAVDPLYSSRLVMGRGTTAVDHAVARTPPHAHARYEHQLHQAHHLAHSSPREIHLHRRLAYSVAVTPASSQSITTTSAS